MDIADLLVPPPESEAWAGCFIGAAFTFLVVFIAFVGAAVSAKTKRQSARRFTAAGLAVVFAVVCVAVGADLDSRYQPPNYNRVLEARLFESYGFTAPDMSWSDVDRHGSEGFITTMSRDGDEFSVKVSLDGNRMVIVGADGREIPANPTSESSQ